MSTPQIYFLWFSVLLLQVLNMRVFLLAVWSCPSRTDSSSAHGKTAEKLLCVVLRSRSDGNRSEMKLWISQKQAGSMFHFMCIVVNMGKKCCDDGKKGKQTFSSVLSWALGCGVKWCAVCFGLGFLLIDLSLVCKPLGPESTLPCRCLHKRSGDYSFYLTTFQKEQI